MTRDELQRQMAGAIRQAFDAGVRHTQKNQGVYLNQLVAIATSHAEAFAAAEVERDRAAAAADLVGEEEA